MKKKSIYICALLALSLGSCQDKLDQAPLSDASAANFYRNTDDFIQAVNGVYAQLRPFPDRYYDLSETRSDNVYGSSSTGVRDWDPVNDFAITLANNALVAEAWNNNFNGIMRANTVLDKLNASLVPDPVLRGRLEGEARFLRALYYFDLVRWFGKLPIMDKVVSPAEALDIPRSPVPDVYALIMDDLTKAIGLLPDTRYGGTNIGRANSWAAQALLARVHLTRSGPNYNTDGPGLGVSEYAQALTLLNGIINGSPYAWVSNYASIFSYKNENNNDIIFDVQFQSGNGLGTTLPGYMGTPAYFNATPGIPLPQSSVEMREISDDLLNAYEADDARKAVTIQQGFTDANGFAETRSFYRKFLDETSPGADRFDWPINFPLIRYTDVLLMKAEAILQGAPGTQQEVDDIVNMVRARAGLDPVSNVTLDMLLQERRLEFAGEGLRWHDLVRTGTVIQKMNDWLPQEDELNRMPESIEPFNVIYPIPFTQLTVKDGLYQQNPGY
ncbi:RagB/SusD family nutrient uptake outer membrane protein [Pontibacter sp. E15-1]|uniref:RagB/SusD family nutrient uptake outer membrane protein n=1 Tax=Pontibacter sp. E15-1 TaxID=2919918 RepID=UPI001F4FF1D3|nr:RagB/SusD family nutrient uptake outer membrane protein [Pontibacter sp. E15-1]MCJ8166546.1 RagB/SusD family nutrient uptake outer membrane protein [Pontibacter sp. E15-1]